MQLHNWIRSVGLSLLICHSQSLDEIKCSTSNHFTWYFAIQFYNSKNPARSKSIVKSSCFRFRNSERIKKVTFFPLKSHTSGTPKGCSLQSMPWRCWNTGTSQLTLWWAQDLGFFFRFIYNGNPKPCSIDKPGLDLVRP